MKTKIKRNVQVHFINLSFDFLFRKFITYSSRYTYIRGKTKKKYGVPPKRTNVKEQSAMYNNDKWESTYDFCI